MASIGISEFTFGFAFLYEQAHAKWSKLKAAPILPSLQQEQQQGWDAHLPLKGTDFYYQFKLSDHLSAWNAKYISDGTYQSPYYRLSLHRKNKNEQHRRLRVHARNSPHTYYVAPEIQVIEDFNTAYLSRQITARSRLIPVRACKAISDGKQHHITFQSGSSRWKQHSEVFEGEISYRGEELERVYRDTSREWRPIDDDFATDIFHKSSELARHVFEHEGQAAGELARPLLDFNPRVSGRSATLLRASEILSVVLGTTLVLVGSPD